MPFYYELTITQEFYSDIKGVCIELASFDSEKDARTCNLGRRVWENNITLCTKINEMILCQNITQLNQLFTA